MCVVVNLFVVAILLFIDSLFYFNHPDATLTLNQNLQGPLNETVGWCPETPNSTTILSK